MTGVLLSCRQGRTVPQIQASCSDLLLGRRACSGRQRASCPCLRCRSAGIKKGSWAVPAVRARGGNEGELSVFSVFGPRGQKRELSVSSASVRGIKEGVVRAFGVGPRG